MKSKLRHACMAVAIVAMLILAAQILFLIGVKIDALPSPAQVGEALLNLFLHGSVLNDISASVFRVLAGFFVAGTTGISLGLLFAWQPKAHVIDPIIELIRPIPPIAWVPFAIIVFGLGNQAAIFIVFLGAFFPIFTNTYAKASELSTTLRNTCFSYGISGWPYIRNVLFYQSLPGILSGLRIGIGMAWMSVIAAELVGAQSGLGYLIQYNGLLLRTDYVLAGMILIGVIGYILTATITSLERVYARWLGHNL